ncbi:MAG: hypothetical protein N3C12_07165 [Candidatus Binatia bacterium]|nr:hypothetical protein [Candidatus Binatia bacterium]
MTIEELILGVRMALGDAGPQACFDDNSDGVVTVNELSLAVNRALSNCPTGGTLFGECRAPAGSYPPRTVVRIYRCEQRAGCLQPGGPSSARVLLAMSDVASDGAFPLPATLRSLGAGIILLEAELQGGTV